MIASSEGWSDRGRFEDELLWGMLEVKIPVKFGGFVDGGVAEFI